VLANKYLLLLISRPDSALLSFVPELKRYNFSVVQASSAERGLSFVRSSPRLSMVSMDDGIGLVEAVRVLREIKALQPGLPVIWTSSVGAAVDFKGAQPDAILNVPFSADEFHREATRLLCEHFYAPDLVQELSDTVVQGLAQSFNTDVEPQAPFLKGTRVLGGDMSALLYFYGPGIEGHLIVSSSAEYFCQLRRRTVPGAETVNLVEAGDVAGELANVLLGRFNVHLRARVANHFAMGTPVLLQGSNLVLRRMGGSPALGIDFEGPQGKIFVEFCFDSFNPGEFDPKREPDVVPSGDIIFL
jgi:CheY-specific phosphatase CheX